MKDLFVPEAHTASFPDLRSHRPGPLYAHPFTFADVAPASALGIARHAIEAFIDIANHREITLAALGGQKVLLRMSPHAQVAVSRVEGLVRSARSLVYEVVAEIWAALARNEPLSKELRASFAATMTNAHRSCTEAVDLLYKTNGGSSVYARCPLERCFRDIHTVSQHHFTSVAFDEKAGQVLLGLEPAEKHKLVHYNEASLSENPKFTIPEWRTLTNEEVGRFLVVIKGSRYEALYMVGLYLGARRGEIVGMAWQKIDWAERTVIIDQQVQRFGGGAGVRITPTKGNKQVILPLNPTLYHCLHNLWLAQGQPTEGLLFRGVKDPTKPLDPMSWYRDFKRHLRLAGLPVSFRAHDMRHTAATNVINRGGTTKDAAEMLGHQSTRHTERYARRLGMDRKRQTAERMEQMGKGHDQD